MSEKEGTRKDLAWEGGSRIQLEVSCESMERALELDFPPQHFLIFSGNRSYTHLLALVQSGKIKDFTHFHK